MLCDFSPFGSCYPALLSLVTLLQQLTLPHDTSSVTLSMCINAAASLAEDVCLIMRLS